MRTVLGALVTVCQLWVIGAGAAYLLAGKEVRKARRRRKIKPLRLPSLGADKADRFSPVVATGPDEPTALYRWFDADDQLLYVGISNNVVRRSGEHAKAKAWMRQAVRNTVEWLPDRASALAAEEAAIESEHPKHNIVHNR